MLPAISSTNSLSALEAKQLPMSTELLVFCVYAGLRLNPGKPLLIINARRIRARKAYTRSSQHALIR